MKESTDSNVRAVLLHLVGEGYGAVSYSFLLGYLRGVGIEPRGMDPINRQLEREGYVDLKDPSGDPWHGFDEQEGPLWIHLRPALLLQPEVLDRASQKSGWSAGELREALDAVLSVVNGEAEAANG